jgi:putative hydrolase of HD superfamily
MITQGLVERLFEAASIQRWNDHVRPVEFVELDKQAHKMVIAYVLGRFQENDQKVEIDWKTLIEGGIFEFLQRVILTDIKAPVFHQLMARKGRELNAWALSQLQPAIEAIGGDFSKRMHQYFNDSVYASLEKRILRAAHYLATNWEFKIIYNASPFIYGIEKTKEEIENQIEDHYDLIGVQKITLGKKSYGFVDLCGQLRFQQRWAQSPRIPKTSVLGHMFIVAILSYCCSVDVDACKRRLYNNFFAALFHDLPEVLTRDIVSPVKTSVAGLDSVIKEYEHIQMEEKIMPLLPDTWHDEFRYFVDDEFSNRVRIDGVVNKTLSFDKIQSDYNYDEFDAVDGVLLKACDHFAAFVEASLSIQHGITARPLEECRAALPERYRGVVIGGIDFGRLYTFFQHRA